MMANNSSVMSMEAPVRIYEFGDRGPVFSDVRPEPKAKAKEKRRVDQRHLADNPAFRRYGITVVAIGLLALWTVITCCITAYHVKKTVTEELTHQFRGYTQQWIDEQEQQRMAAELITGDESFEMAVNDFADKFDELIATYSMDYGLKDDALHTLGWVFIARVIQASGEFGKTPEEIISKSGAWEGNVIGHAVRPQDTKIATEIARAYLSGEYPDGFTPNMVFFTREANGGGVARDQFITSSKTVYWRWKL